MRFVIQIMVVAVVCARALGTDYYVRTTGSDVADGLTPATAWRSVHTAAQRMNAGDTAFVGGGVYAERVTFARSGTAALPIRVEGDPDGGRTGDSGDVIITAGGASVVEVSRDFIQISDVVIRGSGAGSVAPLRWLGGESGMVQSVAVENGTGALVEVVSGSVEFDDGVFDGGGGDGLIVRGGTTRADGVRVRNVAGRGVVVENTGTMLYGHRIDVRGASTAGLHAENGRAYIADSLFSVTGHGCVVAGADGYVLLANSTVAGCGGDGVRVEGGGWYGLGSIVSHNTGIALRNIAGLLQDNTCLVFAVGGGTESGSVLSGGRVASDPLFVNIAGGDFRLFGSSPAVDAGHTDAAMYATMGWTPIDLDGVSREAVSGYEIGAYEFAGGAAEVPYTTGFDGGVDAFWSGTQAGLHGGDAYHGVFNGTDAQRDAAELRVRTTVGMLYILTFDVLLMGSWDGSQGSYGPDTIAVLASGTSIFSETFSRNGRNATHGGQPDSTLSTGSVKVYSRITVVFEATGPVTALRWSSDVTGNDEDFAIDNVQVRTAAEGCELGLRASWVWGFPRPASVMQVDFSSPQLSSIEYDVNWSNQTTASFHPNVPRDVFGVKLEGFITAPTAGDWEFRLSSDDGSRMWIDGSEVIENDGFHSPRKRTGTATLSAGAHQIEIRMFEWTGRQDLVLEWRPAGGSWAVVPVDAFCHNGGGLFTDVTSARGFVVAGTTSAAVAGVRIGDMDGDGWQDVFVGGAGAAIAWNGGLVGPWETGSPAGQQPWRQAALMDFENDGDLDAWVVRLGSWNTEGAIVNGGARSLSFRSDLGLSAPTNNEGVAAADINADGLIDVVMFSASGNYVGVNTGEPDDDLGPPVAFDTDDSLETGLNSLGDRGNGDFVSSADVNGDGRADFFYHYGGGRLFLSNGDGTYTQNAMGISVRTAEADKFGSAWGDYDNDGDMDLFAPDHRDGQRGLLYRNDGDRFTEVGVAAGIDDVSEQRSSCWGDVDNDGDLDLYITTDGDAINALYENNGDGTFALKRYTNAEIAGVSHDACFADLDHDGDLDLVLAREGEPAVLLRNNTDDGAALQVAFVGRGAGQTNAAGIGVRVELFDGAGTRLGRRELGGARGFGGQEPLRAHFGGIDPTVLYTVRFTVPRGDVYESTVIPGGVRTVVGATVIAGLYTFEEPAARRFRIVRWREISPVD